MLKQVQCLGVPLALEFKRKKKPPQHKRQAQGDMPKQNARLKPRGKQWTAYNRKMKLLTKLTHLNWWWEAFRGVLRVRPRRRGQTKQQLYLQMLLEKNSLIHAALSACLFAGNLALQRRKKYSFVFILTRQLAIITNTFFPLFSPSFPPVRWARRCDAKCLSLKRGKVASVVAGCGCVRTLTIRVLAEFVCICMRIKIGLYRCGDRIPLWPSACVVPDGPLIETQDS